MAVAAKVFWWAKLLIGTAKDSLGSWPAAIRHHWKQFPAAGPRAISGCGPYANPHWPRHWHWRREEKIKVWPTLLWFPTSPNCCACPCQCVFLKRKACLPGLGDEGQSMLTRAGNFARLYRATVKFFICKAVFSRGSMKNFSLDATSAQVPLKTAWWMHPSKPRSQEHSSVVGFTQGHAMKLNSASQQAAILIVCPESIDSTVSTLVSKEQWLANLQLQ